MFKRRTVFLRIVLTEDMSVKIRSHFVLQIGIAAYDSLRPARRASATVTVSVLRNPNSPRFNNLGGGLVTVEELTPVSSVIFNISASDADGVSTNVSSCYQSD